MHEMEFDFELYITVFVICFILGIVKHLQIKYHLRNDEEAKKQYEAECAEKGRKFVTSAVTFTAATLAKTNIKNGRKRR